MRSTDNQRSMLNTTNYTRTIWNRDSYRIPEGSNLYGAHPVYYDHRGDNGTHAVFLLNSDGMFNRVRHQINTCHDACAA